MDKPETSSAVISTAVAAALLGLVVLSSFLVYYMDHAAPSSSTTTPDSETDCSMVVNNTACPPPTDCQLGVLAALDGSDTGLCRVFDKSVGSACTSQCYASGAETTCDSEHECSSTNVSACLGYCELTDPDTTDGESRFVQYSHEACVGKLKFKDYFIWNLAGNSSDSASNWLKFSDIDADCFAEHGCMWYSTALRFYQDATPDNWFPTTGTIYACVDFLDMENTECIHSQTLELNSNASDVMYRNWLDPYTVANLSAAHFQATVCNFWYECAPLNQTYYTDPDFHQKRSIAAASPANVLEAYVAHMKRSSERLAKYPPPAMEQFRKRFAR